MSLPKLKMKLEKLFMRGNKFKNNNKLLLFLIVYKSYDNKAYPLATVKLL